MAQYKYYTQVFIKEGVDFNEIFADKQKAVAGKQNIAFSLPDVVQFIKTQSLDFSKQDQYLIDLDMAVMRLIAQYRNVSEKPKEEAAKNLQVKQPFTVGAGMTPTQKTQPAESDTKVIEPSENEPTVEEIELAIDFYREEAEENPKDKEISDYLFTLEELYFDLVGKKYAAGGRIDTFARTNGSLIKSANFTNGSNVHLKNARLHKSTGAPYKNPYKFTVYNSDDNKHLSFKTLEQATAKFDKLVEKKKETCAIRSEGFYPEHIY
jgi:hypothetical protein